MTSVLLSLLLASSHPLATVAEKSGWTRTGRYDEVVALCAAFPKAFPGKARCHTFGTTPEGRPMLALVASADGTLDPTAARKRSRPVVLVQGAIHAGEVDGKDAGFWLLRDLLEGKAQSGALSKVTVVFVPVFNVDGHERFGRHNRPNQNGPEEMGWRVTSQNLNLNRDYAKADAPEMAAMLRLLNAWDPILYVDLHVTDGAKFEHDVAVMLEPLETGPEALRALGRAMREALFTKLEAQGHLPLPFYPAFEEEDRPASGFSAGIAPPRFSSAYWLARNRFGLLVETHSWKDYATRVKATRDVVEGLLALAAKDGHSWLGAAKAADALDLGRGGTEVVLAYEHTDKSRPLKFRGYAYALAESAVSGKQWVRYDAERPEVWEVPYFYELRPSATAQAPRVGYLVPAAHAAWMAEKLRLHGFSFEVLAGPREAAVEAFRAHQATFKPMPYEGRLVATLEGAWAPEVRHLPAGSLFVPIAQRASPLLVHLFDPAGRDSFASWGFFNAHFEQKEYLEDYVAEEVARKVLAEDAGVKAEFEQRLAADPAFAQDSAARLEFFYRRHPSWDERHNLYPVYRLQAPLGRR